MQSLIDKLQNSNAPSTEIIEICPLCHSNQTKFLFWNFDRYYHLPGKFGLVRCNKCTLVRLSPRPTKENLSFYYPEEKYHSYQPSNTSINNVSERRFLHIIRDNIRNSVLQSMGYPGPRLNLWQKMFQPVLAKFFKKRATFGWGAKLPYFVPGGKALEVGCGSGYHLNFLKQLGWQVNGLEVSFKAAKIAKELYDIDVFCGGITDAPFKKESFDHVHLRHVIEHFTDPLEELKNISEFLKPGGTVYIETPNIESFDQNKNGRFWFPWETPRHLFMFSSETLAQTVQYAGLEILKIKIEMGDFIDWEIIYRIEESAGKILANRSQISEDYRFQIFLLKIYKSVRFFLNNNCGDILCCWAVKK